jgi:hypothetical protein
MIFDLESDGADPCMRNRQVGPDDSTAILAGLVQRLTYKPKKPPGRPRLRAVPTYKPKWRFATRPRAGQPGPDALHQRRRHPEQPRPETTTSFLHLMPVFPAAFNERAWMRWILEQILLVERHEALEFFKIDGESPYFPAHGPGDDPYTVMEIRTRDEAHTPAHPFHSRQVSDEHFA